MPLPFLGIGMPALDFMPPFIPLAMSNFSYQDVEGEPANRQAHNTKDRINSGPLQSFVYCESSLSCHATQATRAYEDLSES